MSSSLRPVLRSTTAPSLPSATTRTTYICQSCRHARLLRRPKRPYTFTQLVAMSDGSAFTIRTTSPMPVYRPTRDTRNAILWNPSSKELLNVEDDEAGRLAGFRARFGTQFDALRESSGDEGNAPKPVPEGVEIKSTTPKDTAADQQGSSKKSQSKIEEDDLYYEFEEDDANILDLISSYGVQDVKKTPPKAAPESKSASGKKGKK